MSFTEHKIRRINSDPQIHCYNYGVIKTFSNQSTPKTRSLPLQLTDTKH